MGNTNSHPSYVKSFMRLILWNIKNLTKANAQKVLKKERKKKKQKKRKKKIKKE